MSIRNSLMLAQLLSLSVIGYAASSNEWEAFKKHHDIYILVKNKHKNEDMWVKFALSELPDDPHQVTWIERADFLPKDDKRKIEDIKKSSVHQCNYHESKVGGADEKFTMLTLGFSAPEEKNYLFVMEDHYTCTASFIVPQEYTPAREKAAQLLAKVKDTLAQAWAAMTGRTK